MDNGRINRRFSEIVNGAKERLSAGKAKCSSCGKLMDNDLRFCTWCGNELKISEAVKTNSDEEIRVCTRCGNRMEEGLQYCTECGMKLEDKADSVPEATHYSIPEAEKKELAPEIGASIICDNCGAKITGTEGFCECCGCRIDYCRERREIPKKSEELIKTDIHEEKGYTFEPDTAREKADEKKVKKSYFKKPGNL